MTHVIPLALALLATTPIDEEQDWPRTFTTEGGAPRPSTRRSSRRSRATS